MNGAQSIMLVLGGARSGKSRYAEAAARAVSRQRIYLATAQAFDDEMRARIARHRADRAEHGWQTIEEPIDLPGALQRLTGKQVVVLVDCLTLWLSNLMLASHDIAAAERALLFSLDACDGSVILVSNEVGMGLVPETELGRCFRDAQGRLNQSVATLSDRVIFVAAGLPLVLKSPGS